MCGIFKVIIIFRTSAASIPVNASSISAEAFGIGCIVGLVAWDIAIGVVAIGIGTSHGAYKFAGKPHLQFDILKQIRQRTKVPLVLHGASGVPLSLVQEAQKYGAHLKGVEGVPDAQIRKAISLGICKINTDSDLRLALDVAFRKFLNRHPEDIDQLIIFL